MFVPTQVDEEYAKLGEDDDAWARYLWGSWLSKLHAFRGPEGSLCSELASLGHWTGLKTIDLLNATKTK